MLSERLTEIYDLLYERFGPQEWWPGDGRFEIIVGAILTQNTNWRNVEKALQNLRSLKLLGPEQIHRLQRDELARLIRPAGYYNVKAGRLKSFMGWLFENYDGDLDAVAEMDGRRLREELLSIKGIGPETADSIALYAFEKPVFVVDAYTARIVSRHLLIEAQADYESLQRLFEDNLAADTVLFNEYHALLVRCGKEYCRRRARCEGCPLEGLEHEVEPQ